jgi:hypothetical protein
MKRLPFERRYQLESIPCETCGGSGKYSLEHTCLNCRSMGRRITAPGRQLFYAICDLLGRPVTERESRIQPDHLELIAGAQVRVGMKVGELLPGRIPKPPLRLVTAVEERNLSLVITFADGTAWPYSDLTLFTRELTEPELQRVDALMADHLGEGAVEGSAVA